MKRAMEVQAASASEAPSGGGTRFKKKKDASDSVSLLQLSQLALEDLELDDAITYPKNRFYVPQLLLRGRGTQRSRPLLKLDAWLELKFGVDSRIWDKSARADGAAAPAADASAAAPRPEAVRLHVQLGAQLAEQLQALDARAEALFETGVDSQKVAWQPMVKKAERGASGCHAVVKAYLVARQGASLAPLTQFKIRHPGAPAAVGSGWDFLQKQLAKYDNFREGRCLLALELQYWCMNGNAGLTLQAYAVVLEASEACCSVGLGPTVDEIFPEQERAPAAYSPL